MPQQDKSQKCYLVQGINLEWPKCLLYTMQFINLFEQETLFRILILMTLPSDDIRTYQKSATKGRIAHI